MTIAPNEIELNNDIIDILNESMKLVNSDLKIKKTIKKSKKKERKSGLWGKIINSVEITDIYPKTLSLELTNNRYYRGACALHPNTSGDSFRYFPDTKTWNCFSLTCSTGGTVIDLHAHINNIDKKDSMIELAKQYKIPFDEFDKEKIETINKIESIYKDYAKKCHENLKKSKYYEIEKQKRKFTDDTMTYYSVGLVNRTIQKQMESTYPEDLLIKAGFINEKGYGHWICGKRIVYPYLGKKLEPKFFIHRGINDEPDYRKYKNGKLIKYVKLIKTGYLNEIPFGLDSINNHLDKPFLIVEGITDAMSVKQENYSCISPVTIHFKDTELEILPNHCKSFEKTVIIFDNEENGAGLKGAEKTLKVLLKNGINGYIGIIPDKYIDKSIKNWKIDVDEFLRDYSLEEFEQIINDSISGFDYFLDTINKQSNQNDVVEIFKLLPKNDLLTQEDTFKKIAKKRDITLKSIRDTYKQYKDNKLLKERKKQEKEKEEKLTIKREEELIAEEMINEFDLKVLEDTKQIIVRENVAYFLEMQDFDNILKVKIERIDRGSYRNIKNDITAMIKDDKKVRIKRSDFCNRDDVIPFQNGIYNFNTNSFLLKEEINNIKPFFYEISHDYKNDKIYNCPHFKKLLSQWIYKKININNKIFYIPKKVLISDIFEAIGLTMTMNTGFKKHFIPLGNTDSGKTQFGNTRNELFDIKNMAGTTLQRIGKNEFGTDNLQFKVCLAVDELPENVIKQTGIIKDLLGGGNLIQGEIKGGKKFLFTPYIKAWFNANYPPKLKNPNDHAFFNRFIFIPFLNNFKRGSIECITHVWKNIIQNPDEMQGIIHEAIKGYNRLLRRNGFRKRLSQNTRHIWLYYSDQMYKFLFDYAEKDNSYHGKITAEEFKENFTIEMQVAWSPQQIYKRLAQYGIIKYMSNKVQKLRGIKWKKGIWDDENNNKDSKQLDKKKLNDWMVSKNT